jgi:hypothetical protein
MRRREEQDGRDVQFVSGFAIHAVRDKFRVSRVIADMSASQGRAADLVSVFSTACKLNDERQYIRGCSLLLKGFAQFIKEPAFSMAITA